MYILQEIQTTNGQTALLPPATYTDRLEAESAYHARLSSAAISTVDIHAVMLHSEYGNILLREYYAHNGRPEE